MLLEWIDYTRATTCTPLTSIVTKNKLFFGFLTFYINEDMKINTYYMMHSIR